MSKIIEIVNSTSEDREFQMFGVNLFRTIQKGETIKVSAETEAEVVYYEKISSLLGNKPDENVEDDPNTEDKDSANEDFNTVDENPLDESKSLSDENSGGINNSEGDLNEDNEYQAQSLNSEFTEYTKEELIAKNKDEIVKIAEELGLDTSGTKAEIADRIIASYN